MQDTAFTRIRRNEFNAIDIVVAAVTGFGAYKSRLWITLVQTFLCIMNLIDAYAVSIIADRETTARSKRQQTECGYQSMANDSWNIGFHIQISYGWQSTARFGWLVVERTERGHHDFIAFGGGAIGACGGII